MTTRPLTVVLAKPPGSGHSKSRLRRDVGDARAERVYRRCLVSVVRAACDSGGLVRLAVDGDPEEVRDAVAGALPDGVPCPAAHRQVGPTFAARQAHEVRQGLAAGHPVVTLVGSDLVGLHPDHLVRCRDLARDMGVALIASPDGGYAALSTTRPLDLLVDVPMSTGDTAATLIRMAARHGVAVARVPGVVVADIDTGEDLRQHGHVLPATGRVTRR